MRAKAIMVVVGVMALVVLAYAAGNSTAPGGSSTEPTLRQLREQRLQTANDMLAMVKSRNELGGGSGMQYCMAEQCLLEALLDLAESDAQRIKALENELSAVNTLTVDLENRVKVGFISPSELTPMKYLQADLRVRIAKLKAPK